MNNIKLADVVSLIMYFAGLVLLFNIDFKIFLGVFLVASAVMSSLVRYIQDRS